MLREMIIIMSLYSEGPLEDGGFTTVHNYIRYTCLQWHHQFEGCMGSQEGNNLLLCEITMHVEKVGIELLKYVS